MKTFSSLVLLLLMAGAFAEPQGCQAGPYPGGVRTSAPISVCFVGRAILDRADRVNQIRSYLVVFERTANIHFQYWGKCPASTPQDGKDYFDGDIRIAIANTGVDMNSSPAPGVGCTEPNPGSSWSHYPKDQAKYRPCLYNLKLFDDSPASTGLGSSTVPFLNHGLHELGHAVGMTHEHDRADATCSPGPGSITQYLTPYDRDSLMHYWSKDPPNVCPDVLGNYDNDGFSPLDRLTLRVLYPEEGRPAEIRGRSVALANELIFFSFGWVSDGVYIPGAILDMEWRINGVFESNLTFFAHNFQTAGTYTVELSVRDFLNRIHTGSRKVEILLPEELNRRASVISMISDTLLGSGSSTIFVDTFESGNTSAWQ